MHKPVTYLETTYFEPYIKGSKTGENGESFIQFTYGGDKQNIPFDLDITLAFSGFGIGYEFSFLITIKSVYKLFPIVKVQDLYIIHIDIVSKMQEFITYKIPDCIVPIPSMDDVVLSLKQAKMYNRIILGYNNN